MTDRGAYKPKAVVKEPKLGDRIRAWRLRFGLTQAKLAQALGADQSSLALWERNKRIPEGPSMLQLVRVLGVSEEALRTGIGFEIPTMPPFGYSGWPDASSGGDLMAVEEKSKSPVVLPMAHPGEVWGVDIGSGAREPLSPEKVLEWLQAAIDEDSAIWIVKKPSGDLKAARRLLKRNPKR